MYLWGCCHLLGLAGWQGIVRATTRMDAMGYISLKPGSARERVSYNVPGGSRSSRCGAVGLGVSSRHLGTQSGLKVGDGVSGDVGVWLLTGDHLSPHPS